MRVRHGMKVAPRFAEAAGHDAAEALGGGVAAEPVSIWKQVAFERGGARVQVADEGRVAGGGQKSAGWEKTQVPGGGGDIEHVAALRHDQFVIEDVAAGDAVIDFQGRGWALEAVFAGLEHAPALDQPDQQKLPAAANHSGAHEQIGDGAGAGAAREFDEDFTLESAIRPRYLVSGPAGRQGRQREGPEDRPPRSHNESR